MGLADAKMPCSGEGLGSSASSQAPHSRFKSSTTFKIQTLEGTGSQHIKTTTRAQYPVVKQHTL